MGNSQTKEARGQLDSTAPTEYSATSSRRNDVQVAAESNGRPSHRPHASSRGSRPDFSSLLGIGGSSHESDAATLEARRENKAEREARRTERERQARVKERERSMREEHVDGGYLVTQGVYVGVEDYNKSTVRQFQIERRLAPFWRGLNDFSESWAEHQLMAAARGMPIPPADEVPPELEYTLSKRVTPSKDRSLKTTTIPIDGRSESFQSDSGRASPNPHFLSTSAQASTSPSGQLFRARAKTLASLGSASRSTSEKDMSPRELKLPHDPFVNGQPLEVFLYKDASECPICFLYYPPYLNTTRCCEQPICSECFVQIKRPDPHPPEHAEADPNAPATSEEERVAQDEGLLVSEIATCPYCKQPEFGITYLPPPLRRGLTYSTGSNPYQVMSARSSQTSVTSAGHSPGPGRRRGTSLSANAPEVITTDKVRPDWASKLAAARAHAARRSAAASALHAAAYLMNDGAQRPIPTPFARRGVLRRSTLGSNEQPTEAQLNAMNFLAERHAALAERSENGGNSLLPPPRVSSSRRNRIDDLEEMMMMEAIRLSLAAEEDRRKKEEKEAKKKAKKEEKEQKKADKAARKHGGSFGSGSPYAESSTAMQRTQSNISSIGPDDSGKGKGAERGDTDGDILPSLDGDNSLLGANLFSSLPGTSQESLSVPGSIPIAAGPFRRSHLRQMSTASSASSSFQEPGSSTPPVNEPMFNFQNLTAALLKDEEKGGNGEHVEHAEKTNGEVVEHDAGNEKGSSSLRHEPKKPVSGATETPDIFDDAATGLH